MRVAIDGRVLHEHFPGIGGYVYHLVPALAQLPHPPAISLLYDPRRPSPRFDLRRLVESAPAVELVPAPASPFSPQSQLLLPRILRRLAPDVFHATYYLMPYWAGVPTVLTVYDFIPLRVPPALRSRTSRPAYLLAHRLAVRRAALCLAISATTAADLQHYTGFPPERVSITHLAPDARFRPAQDRPALEAWQRARGLPPRYALYVGINKPHKNLANLVSAWHRVVQYWQEEWGEIPTLVWAGPQDRRYAEIFDSMALPGLERHVLALGPVSDEELVRLYQGAELFVYPSLYEGFGLPLLEAMACGIPVACSRRPAMTEVAADAALYFEPADSEAMAQALLEVLGNPTRRQELARRAAARAAHFRWEDTARQTLEAYGAALSSNDQKGA